MSIDDIKQGDDAAFDNFDVAELETLEVAQGVALPEMGASSGGDDAAFDNFDVAELETLEVAQGVALPEMGASSGSIGTSSSSSSTCSAC
ncbi:hypothetical protein ASE09_31080 [Streptomyces sp. Root66D1]|nr:hypothetical protein ASE09_31080 [Streptomyces sp. Root66D1]